jgi:formate/nitrite transporter
MTVLIPLLRRNTTLKKVLLNLTVSLLGNFFGSIGSAYLFAYLTGLYSSEPFLSHVTSLAYSKAHSDFWVAFIKGIPANVLVCLAIYQSFASRQLSGKIIAMFFPIAAFASIGFEHSIANMFFISLGMYYGADVSIAVFLLHLLAVILGNIIGGSLLVAVYMRIVLPIPKVSNLTGVKPE